MHSSSRADVLSDGIKRFGNLHGPTVQRDRLRREPRAVALSLTRRETRRKSGFGISPSGPVAQLGARMNGIHEVTGSIPVWSTKPSFRSSIARK